MSIATPKTFAMIKPDAVLDRNIGSILYSVESGGFRIEEMRMEQLSQNLVQRLYQEHVGKPFYAKLEEFTLSAPVVLLMLRHINGDTVALWRKAIGDSDPKRAEWGTLRHRFGRGMPDNAVHGSADIDAAKRELALFFG
jgi:nucleoside-diphosphate kinase